MSIYALEQEGDADELRRYLRESDSPAVRERAAVALGEVGEEDPAAATNALIRAAMDDEAATVRAAAVDAVDGIGGAALTRLLAALGGVAPDEGGSLPAAALAAMMVHDLAEVRMAAATAIGNQAETEAVPALLSRVTDEDPRVRVRVVDTAGRVGDPRAIDPLASLARVAPARVRAIVARSLGGIGGPAALEALEPLLVDDDTEVREAAVIALGAFETCRPVDRLVDRFTDDEPTIRRAAATGIVDLLSAAPPEVSHELRSTVVETLSTTHDGPVVEALVELFEESTDARRRRNAAWLVGRVSSGTGAVIETLVAALADDDETVRQFAATSLLAMDDPAIEAELLEQLDSVVGDAREMVIFVLGKVGSEESRQRLLTLLDDVDEAGIQEQTIGALSRLGGTLPDGEAYLRDREAGGRE